MTEKSPTAFHHDIHQLGRPIPIHIPHPIVTDIAGDLLGFPHRGEPQGISGQPFDKTGVKMAYPGKKTVGHIMVGDHDKLVAAILVHIGDKQPLGQIVVQPIV